VRDVLQAEAGLVRGSYAEITALLRRAIRVDPSFADFVAVCRARGAEITIVSSGIEPIVRDRLDEIGVGEIAIVANGIEPDPNGWRIVFRGDAANGTDKQALVLAARAAGSRTLFIGDGRSDYAAAIAADTRFAKRGYPLARYLTERGIDFISYSSFAEVLRTLDALSR